MPPVPAEFSRHSQSVSVVSGAALERARDELDGLFEPDAQMRPGVEDHGLGADRVGRLHRRAQRDHRLLADHSVTRPEVDEVERVTDHVAEPDPRRDVRETGWVPSGVLGRLPPAPGLCVNTWSAWPPIASIRSTAVSMPPAAERWAP